MRRWILALLLLSCLPLAGCQGLGLRKRAPGMQAADLAVKGSNETAGQLASQAQTRGQTTGVLAGQVIDSFNRRRPGVALQITPLDGGPAFQVGTDENGYFLVQGLQPGKQYKLSARTQPGEEPLAGATMATPPNVVIVIKLTEHLAGDLPRDAGASPGRLPGSPGFDRGPARLGAPRPRTRRGYPPATVPVRPEYISRDDRLSSLPPAAQIRGPEIPRLDPLVGGKAGAGVGAVGSNAGGIFSVPLRMLRGEGTTLAEQRRALMLLYLWSTAAPGGAEALLRLADLERKHAAAGLAVVAIAYEDGAPDEIAERLHFQAERLGVKFPMLLGGGDACPLPSLLDVRRYPTLILVDERGQVLWRGESLTSLDYSRLSETIERRLN